MPVISVTPAGRKRYLEILVPYLLANRAHIDEHHWWLNTTNAEDIAYVEEVTAQHPEFFKINRKEVFDPTPWVCIWQYFADYTDPDTLYLRFDDDICYIAPDAIPKLIACRRANPEPFLVYGNIVNNTFCSYLHQHGGVLPKLGHTIQYAFDIMLCDSGRLAQKIHSQFILDHKRSEEHRWKFPDHIISLDVPCAQINVISWMGKDLREIPELPLQSLTGLKLNIRGRILPAHGEERFLARIIPCRLDRPNLICGNALFAHFAFTHQRPYLEDYTTLLAEYAKLDHTSLAGFRFRSAAITTKLYYWSIRCKVILHHYRRALHLKWEQWQFAWQESIHQLFLFSHDHFPRSYQWLGEVKRKIFRQINPLSPS